MKKLISLLLCLTLFCSLFMPSFADGLAVTFTSDSTAEVGGTLTVDRYALMNNGSITSEKYDALLEGNVIYSWYKNGVLVMEGIGTDSASYEITLSDQGCTLYVMISFFEDSSFAESKKCGEAYSAEIFIAAPEPEITTRSLPDARVGEAYYVKLECTDPDAVFSEIMGSQLYEFGLTLTQYGEIEGTPIKSGNCHVNVRALSMDGTETGESFDITVNAAAPEEDDETTRPGDDDPVEPPADDPVEPPADDPVKPDDGKGDDSANDVPGTPESDGKDENEDKKEDKEDKIETENEDKKEDGSFPWWGYLIIVLAGLALGIGVVAIVGIIILTGSVRRKKRS